jgi:hypothetical protein
MGFAWTNQFTPSVHGGVVNDLHKKVSGSQAHEITSLYHKKKGGSTEGRERGLPVSTCAVAVACWYSLSLLLGNAPPSCPIN